MDANEASFGRFVADTAFGVRALVRLITSRSWQLVNKKGSDTYLPSILRPNFQGELVVCNIEIES